MTPSRDRGDTGLDHMLIVNGKLRMQGYTREDAFEAASQLAKNPKNTIQVARYINAHKRKVVAKWENGKRL